MQYTLQNYVRILCNSLYFVFAKYKCYLNDIKEIQTRLKERTRMISQISQVDSEFAFREQVEASKKPFNLECLVVDSGKPIDSYIDKVILYIKN